MKRKPELYRTKFGKFIRARTVRVIVKQLSVRGVTITPHAVYNWVSGLATPSTPVARALTRMSGGKITLEDMQRHRETIERIRSTNETVPPCS